tara:strand:+ start:3564 stop:3809 length:246 start_codon:yes stop_codon:yes gene_type:complete
VGLAIHTPFSTTNPFLPLSITLAFPLFHERGALCLREIASTDRLYTELCPFAHRETEHLGYAIRRYHPPSLCAQQDDTLNI